MSTCIENVDISSSDTKINLVYIKKNASQQPIWVYKLK